MTPPRITLLYEDHGDPGGGVIQFGPHNLLVRCVLDDLAASGAGVVDFFTARREVLIGNARNSNSKVQAECRRIRSTLARGGAPVVALYDLDKIHHLLPQGPVRQRRCKREMRELLASDSDASELLRVYFLDRNVETLTTEAARLLGRSVQGKPSPAERDSLLNLGFGLVFLESRDRREGGEKRAACAQGPA